MALVLIAALGAWFALNVGTLLYMIRLKEYRTDIGRNEPFTAGESWGWELNVLRASNYTPEGQGKLEVLYGLIVVQVVSGIGILMFAV